MQVSPSTSAALPGGVHDDRDSWVSSVAVGAGSQFQLSTGAPLYCNIQELENVAVGCTVHSGLGWIPLARRAVGPIYCNIWTAHDVAVGP